MSALRKVIWFFICLVAVSGIAQVGINTSTPAPGALLDINSSDKGLLITRVALQSIDTYAPITPDMPRTTGLLVYNTVTDGIGSLQVTPGFYYWSGTRWRRFFNQGYTIEKQQMSEVRAQTNTRVLIPDLDTGPFSVPFNGTYQIIATAYFANGANTDTGGGQNYDGASQGAIILDWDPLDNDIFEDLKQSYITSSSKYLDDSDPTDYMNFLAQSVTIVYNIDLEAGRNYQFRVLGEQWATRNSEDGWFGKDTDAADYPGATSVDTQRGSLSITLVRQF